MKKNRVISLIGILLLASSSIAQPFTLDPTFQTSFNFITTTSQRAKVGHILESEKNGKLFLTGNFALRVNNQNYPYIRVFRNGNYDPSCAGSNTLASGVGEVIPININNHVLVASSGNYLVLDTTGLVNNSSWRTNYRKTVSCSEGFRPYFYSDGSSLMGNSRGIQPTSCRIINPPDTFPHRYIIKVDPNGLWDSSFIPDANEVPRGFLPYDSTRILVWGLPRLLTQYDGRPINGLCRIFLDGTLDTTFQSPVRDNLSGSSFLPIRFEERDELFLVGTFFLKGDTTNQRYIVRLKENGDVDSSFAFSNATHTASWWKGLGSVAPTPDGGYIVAGAFDHYQGVAKNALAKLDSNGVLEPQYFTSTGPDSSALLGLGFPVVEVKESKFGGYYVFGDFTKWDGQATQPIVRLRDLVTGIRDKELGVQNLKLWPNPVQEELMVQLASYSNGIQEIQVLDLLGKEQVVSWENNANQAHVNTSSLANGVYLIRIRTNQGVITQKVVKN